MAPEHFALGLLIGIVTGFINTLAGSGSLITLPFLMFMGLPPTMANATNRINILLSSLVGFLMLKKATRMNFRKTGILIFPAIVGAFGGSLIAVDIEEEVLRIVIMVVMGLMLFPVIMNSKKWLRESGREPYVKNKPFAILVFFSIGLYGGFLQAGIGIMFLSALVLIANYSLTHGNVIKNLISFVYTIPALTVFIINGQVDWVLGLLLAAGQMLGAAAASYFASKTPNAGKWIRILLIVMIVGSLGKLIFDLIMAA